jgi:ArsR family transcriptional regulator
MYSQIFQLHADVYSALANPKRLEIIQLLRDQELAVGEMQDMLGLPQANLSQHLAVLRDHGLAATRKQGTAIYYRLSHPNLIASTDLIREMLVDRHRGDQDLTEELRLRMKDLVPLTKDPICGMRLSPKTAAAAVKRNSQTYYFCAAGCRDKYIKTNQLF